MTNAEAIEQLRTIPANMVEREALQIAIAALREKADKERRYVVEKAGCTWAVYRCPDRACMACHIETEQAAQAIADIYEGVKQ